MTRTPDLMLSRPGDASERQADAIADRVARAPEEEIDAQGSAEIRSLARGAGRPPIRASAPASGLAGGSALDAPVRRHLEAALGVNLGGVRVHTDAKADLAARSIGARAFTVGSDIAFAEGEYATRSPGGWRLLAHEVAHTLQPRNTAGAATLVRRDLAAFKGEHLETLPSSSDISGVTQEVTSADAPAILAALTGLIGAGKIGTRDDGTRVFFFGLGATRAEIVAALSAFPRAGEMADALLDKHDLAVYSHERLTRFVGLITATVSKTKENVDVQGRRPLTSFERGEARLVFGGNIDLDRIVLEEDPVMGVLGYARTTPSTVNFPLGAFKDPRFMPWLIHELTHSWQYQHGVSVGTTAYHAVFSSYDYGGEAGLRAASASGKKLRGFNTEQQGDIAQDYYNRVKAGLDVSAWQPFIDELRTP